MMLSQKTKINILKSPTKEDWIEQAINNLDTILLDHSHCERKAASVALNLMFRYSSNAMLVRKSTAITKEELEHFEQVNQWLYKKKYSPRPLIFSSLWD